MKALNAAEAAVLLCQVAEAEVDERWSFVGGKQEPRWLWQALDQQTWQVLTYGFGKPEDQAFVALKALLKPFGMTRFYTAGWGAYQRHIEPERHEVGKRNTQRLERKHLNLRTRLKRLARKTICFSTSIQRHDIVISLFINQFEFEVIIYN